MSELPTEGGTPPILIPAGLAFASLGLSRDSRGGFAFDVEPLRSICEANGLAPSDEDEVADVLVAWYVAARERGEPEDRTMEEAVGEAWTERN